LEQSYATLEEKNKLLEEKNTLLKSYTSSLEKKNNELEKFASIASHDLKSPLRAIGSLTSMIEDELDSKDEELKSHFGTIRNRVHRMENLLNALLDYSKIERTQNLYELVDFKMVITDVIQQLHPTENVSIEIPEKLPTIRGDYKKMIRVVYALLENAIIHNNEKEITISISTTRTASSVFVTISDNGLGIEEKYFDKIFVIFQTLQRRDEKETMGIGLSIARKIIEDMGGTLTVKSTLGEGSSFTIEIPIKCLVHSTITPLQEEHFSLIEN
jgi:light-regulated signal transduction histidine kinase (bacteriophytochrome)